MLALVKEMDRLYIPLKIWVGEVHWAPARIDPWTLLTAEEQRAKIERSDLGKAWIERRQAKYDKKNKQRQNAHV